jgi:hypothetical protein
MGKLIKYKYYLFFIISFILYGNTIKNDYSLDDNFVTNNNITTKGLSSIPNIFTTHYVIYGDGRGFEYRPIVKLSYAIEHHFFGVNAHLGHFINILLYALCLIILFKTLVLIFTENQIQLIFLSVLVFAFLPIHSEVVASLKNRDVLLCFIFSFLSFIYFYNGIHFNKKPKIIIGFIFLITALLSKLDALPMLALFPLIIFYNKSINLKKVVMICISIVALFFLYKTFQSFMLNNEMISKRHSYIFENPLFANKSFLLKLSTSLNSLGFYIKSFFIPFHFSSYYGYNTIPVYSFFSTYSIIGVITIVFSCIGIFKFYKSPNHPILIGILFFIVSISMFLNFAKPVPGIVGERFAFFASIGLSILLSNFFVNILKNKKVTISVILIITVTFTTSIVKRNKDWKSEKTLFESDLKNNPNSAKLNILCANGLISEIKKNNSKLSTDQIIYKTNAAKGYLLKAYSLDSTYYKISNNLGFISMSIDNNPLDAIKWFKKSLKSSTSKYELNLNIGLCFAKKKLLDSADHYFIRAFSIKPKNQKLKSDLFNFYKSTNQLYKYYLIYP